MNRMSATCMFFFVGIAVLFVPGSVMSGDDLDFAVIQPGQPGAPEEAQPVMDALAAYIQKKMGPGFSVKGIYFNELDPALDFVHNNRPRWGIVRLGFYSEQAIPFQMTAIASTRPGGSDTDIWRLLVSREGPGEWKAVQGTILGNMLFEKDAAACLLFEAPSDQLPFTLQGTFHPLRSLREVIKGKTAGVVLDRSQHEAVKALPLAGDIAVIFTSRELPTSPVVWFGEPDIRAQGLTSILMGMKEDSDAQTLLKLLQTDGFGPADPNLPKLRQGGKGTVCFQ
jgi:hypothetical protein